MIKPLTQKEAVYKTVLAILTENGVDFTPSQDDAALLIDRDLRKQMKDSLSLQFNTGLIVLNKGLEDKELEIYVGGLLSNWIKKDPRLNGNIEHEIKSPGSRIGQSDPVVRELRKVLKVIKGTDSELAVKRELKIRQNTLRKAQIASIKIDASLIPESVRHLISPEQQ